MSQHRPGRQRPASSPNHSPQSQRAIAADVLAKPTRPTANPASATSGALPAAELSAAGAGETGASRARPGTRREQAIRHARHLPFALIALLATYLLTLNVGVIWHSSHEDNGVVFENIAITHIRYGLAFTKGQDFYDPSVQSPAITWRGIGPRGVDATQQFRYFLRGPTHPTLYGHHPPLLGLTVAGAFLIFGYHYWAERLVPITYTLAALLVFYALMSLLFDPLVATFASLLFTLFPITAYYGRNVAHEAPTMFWELGMLLCYALWTRSGQRRWLMALAACVGVGVFAGWPMVYFACVLFAVDFARRKALHGGLLAATVITALGVCAVVVAQIAVAAGGSLRTLETVGVIRANGSVGSDYTPLGWVGQLLWLNAGDFGAWAVLAAPAASLFLFARFRQERLSLRMVVLATLALGALAHILIWRQAAYIHDYWQFYLIPFYAAAIGWAGVTFARRICVGGKQRAALLAVTLAIMACIVFALDAPLIYNLYAGGLPYEARATGPVTPLIPISPLPLSWW